MKAAKKKIHVEKFGRKQSQSEQKIAATQAYIGHADKGPVNFWQVVLSGTILQFEHCVLLLIFSDLVQRSYLFSSVLE